MTYMDAGSRMDWNQLHTGTDLPEPEDILRYLAEGTLPNHEEGTPPVLPVLAPQDQVEWGQGPPLGQYGPPGGCERCQGINRLLFQTRDPSRGTMDVGEYPLLWCFQCIIDTAIPNSPTDGHRVPQLVEELEDSDSDSSFTSETSTRASDTLYRPNRGDWDRQVPHMPNDLELYWLGLLEGP